MVPLYQLVHRYGKENRTIEQRFAPLAIHGDTEYDGLRFEV
jgi:hypothetical protein